MEQAFLVVPVQQMDACVMGDDWALITLPVIDPHACMPLAGRRTEEACMGSVGMPSAGHAHHPCKTS